VTSTAAPFAIDGRTLRHGNRLGRGGQGQVVEVLGPGEALVAKWYLPTVVLDAAALTRLVAWRRSLAPSTRAAVDAVACWPRAVLLREGRARGVLLPRVPPAFTFETRHPAGTAAPVLRELQHLIARPALLSRRGIPEVGPLPRLRVLTRLVSAVALLHGHDIVLGDLSVKNMVWSAAGDARVWLLDCDALRLTGTDPAVSQSNSPGWDDPSFPGTQNQQSDRYKLALAVLRVLARDFHTRDPERAAAALSRDFLPILRAGLSRDPDARPPVAAWLRPLRDRVRQLTNQRKR
jgi:DNA-binding helix-hairpin-helix protein with protein kinase domain